MKYLIILSLLFLSGCASLEPFPVKNIYEYINSTKECYEYYVVNNDPLTVSDGKLVDVSLCEPSIMGFNSKDAGKVFDWIRKAQQVAKQKCSD
jgi:hypothetical protein